MTPSPADPRSHPARPDAGFTLIEILVVVVFTALVLGAAMDFYIDLSRASRLAAEKTRTGRHTAGVLDRLARDLEASTLLVKPEAMDPLAWPWLFYAEAGGGEGAERLRFVTRGRRARGSQTRASDLEVVSWVLREGEEGDLELWRWSGPQLPESLDRSFPPADAAGSQRVTRGVASFAVRFLDQDGNWSDAWDSSTLVQSGQLPRAAEIALELRSESDANDPLAAFQEPQPWRRHVRIPVPALDLTAALDRDDGAEAGEDGEGDDEPGDCFSVGECLDRNRALFDGLSPDVQASILSIQDQCYDDWAGSLPVDLENCP